MAPSSHLSKTREYDHDYAETKFSVSCRNLFLSHGKWLSNNQSAHSARFRKYANLIGSIVIVYSLSLNILYGSLQICESDWPIALSQRLNSTSLESQIPPPPFFLMAIRPKYCCFRFQYWIQLRSTKRIRIRHRVSYERKSTQMRIVSWSLKTIM